MNDSESLLQYLARHCDSGHQGVRILQVHGAQELTVNVMVLQEKFYCGDNKYL